MLLLINCLYQLYLKLSYGLCSYNLSFLDEAESGKSESELSSRKKAMAISEQEKIWRRDAYDYEMRFCGHCNTTTDIKEANFFGR